MAVNGVDINMKDIWKESTINNINNQKKILPIVLIIIIISVILIGILYLNNSIVREWIDKNIFRKEVKQDKATTIDLKEINTNIYAFNKYIGILNKNKFEIYNNSGNKEEELEIQISNPYFDSSNRFLAIAESYGQKLYVISDKNIMWEDTVDGEISQVHINKNGYVAVVVVNTSHKTVIVIYNAQGEELFKIYISSNRTSDVSISNDNKHIAIAEVDTSGSIIQSNVKILSIEKARSKKEDSLENTYKSENGKLITNIEYHDKNKLVCMYTDSIRIIEDGQDKELINNKNKKVLFQSVETDNSIISVEEKSSGLFTADSIVNIINVENQNTKQYQIKSIAKELYSYGDIIALNLGTEIEFINKGGWLVKRYIAKQEITNIVLSNNIAGIVYRDKIEIVNL